MKAIALTEFRDIKENVLRQAGDEFEVSEKRFDEINAKGIADGFGRLINKVQDEPLSPAGKRAAKKEQK